MCRSGVEVRKGFEDSDEKRYIGLKGPLGKDKQIGMLETTTPFIVPKPKPKNYRAWQADHVQDLAFYATIALQKVPEGIDFNDWATVHAAICGEVDVSRILGNITIYSNAVQDKVTEPGDNTKTLGRVLSESTLAHFLLARMTDIRVHMPQVIYAVSHGQ